MRSLYSLLRLLSLGKALSRGPGALVKRQARRTAHGKLSRTMRRRGL